MRVHLWAAIFYLLVFAFSTLQAEEPGEITIGAIASLSGPAAEQGQNWLRGAELAIEELRAEGIPVTLKVENDETKSALAAAAFQKLATIDKTQGIIGGTWDYLAQTLYPLAAQYRIPLISPTNSFELLSEQERKNSWIFTNGLHIAAEKAAIREFLIREKITSLALIYPQIAWGTVHAQMMRELAEELQIRVVYENEFPLEGYLEVIKIASLRIADLKPDLVYVTFDYQGLDLITTEFQKLQINPRLLDTQHIDSALNFSKNPQKYKNTYGVYPKISDDNFNARFERKFKHPPRVYSAAGYDATKFLAYALRAKVEFGTQSVKFEYQGVTGLHQLPASQSSLVKTTAVVMTTRNGRFESYP